MINDLDISTIKLIIWDLDDTFWDGIISSNHSSATLNNENIEFVKTLTDCGIINSICSKNNFSDAKNIFKKYNIYDVWDLFVFPSINWNSKGERIKEIINKTKLREQNVLFIDDNVLNLEEAKFYNPEIQTALPDKIPDLIRQISKLEPQDKTHSRLKHYKILEERNRQKNIIGSNEKFLYSSNIKVEINSECPENIDRITELINRTNQLNYTKNRMEESQIKELLQNKDIENRFITVKDKFGDWGICGFYSLNKTINKLIHFVFSCRTMGMGVEQYVYAHLNFPDIEIIGDVAIPLNKKEKCEWINQNLKTVQKQKQANSEIKILFKGPCDMRGVADYLSLNYDNFMLDFSYLDDEGMIKDNACRLINVVNSHKLSDETKKLILQDTTFITKELYNQPIFENKFDIIVFSLLLDATSRIYRHKPTGEKIAWNSYPPFTEKENYNNFINFQEAGAKNIWNEEQLKSCINKYEHLGFMSPEEIIENIEYLINAVDKNTKWIFIIGSDVKPDKEQEKTFFNYRYTRRKEINPKLIKYLKKKKNVSIIEMSKLITSNQDYLDSIDHFKREVYFNLSKELAKRINKLTKKSILQINFVQKNKKNTLIFSKIKVLSQKISRLIFIMKIQFFD